MRRRPRRWLPIMSTQSLTAGGAGTNPCVLRFEPRTARLEAPALNLSDNTSVDDVSVDLAGEKLSAQHIVDDRTIEISAGRELCGTVGFKP